MRASLGSKVPLVALCAWCMALLAVRVWYSGVATYDFLGWNLLLAVIPMVAAVTLRALPPRHRALFAAEAVLFGAWLAFLPNAPYLVTDLVHLRHTPPVPIWFDVSLFGSFAATGVLLGYSSVVDARAAVTARLGRGAGAVVTYASFALCGFGIYLGRFLRWNTWDVLTSPMLLFAQIADRFVNPASHPQTWAVSVLYGGALTIGYLALRGLSAALVEAEDMGIADRPRGARRRVERRLGS